MIYSNAVTRKDITRASGVEGTTFENFGYDGLSRMISAQNDYSNITMAYDSMNNLLTETQQIGSQSVKSVASAYDNMGFRTSLTYPNSRQISFTSDNLNRIQQIVEIGQSIATYSYEGPIRVKDRTYLNSLKLTATYDGNRRPTNYEHRNATNDLITGFAYQFDKEDNKLYEKRLLDNKGDAFLYDAIYRLTGVKYGVPNLNPATDYADYITYDSKEEFQMDGVGNRIQVTNGTTTNYTTNNLNQYTEISGTNYIYDDNGNLTNDGTKTFVYDYANRLLKVTRISDSQVLGEYKYDSLGRRIQRTYFDNSSLITHNYYYDGARCIEERDNSDTVIAQYVFGNNIDEVLTMERGVQTYYYHENSLGSIYALTDNSGNVVERYSYSAYGQVSFYDGSGTPISNSLISNRYLFTGRELDTESGLYYFRARYYSAELGRFLGRDTKEDDNLTNLYTYVQNNPINLSDPFGTDKNKGQINTGNPTKQKPVTVKPEEPVTPTTPTTLVLPPDPNPKPVILRAPCSNKEEERNKIMDAYKTAVDNANKQSGWARTSCTSWQQWVWTALRNAANSLYNTTDGQFNCWNYDAVNFIVSPPFFFHRAVALWQKDELPLSGYILDPWISYGAWVLKNPPLVIPAVIYSIVHPLRPSPPIYRNWDKTKTATEQ